MTQVGGGDAGAGRGGGELTIQTNAEADERVEGGDYDWSLDEFVVVKQAKEFHCAQSALVHCLII